MAAGGPLVLVVDDEAAMRRLARTALELEGYQVVEAATLAQARSITAERIGAVVLDRRLPDGDGLDLLDELRARWPGATIVLHSAEPVPGPYRSIAKGDVVALAEILGPAAPTAAPGAPDVARAHADEIVEAWVESQSGARQRVFKQGEIAVFRARVRFAQQMVEPRHIVNLGRNLREP